MVTTQLEKLEALETPPKDGNNESGEPTSLVDATTPPAPGSSTTQSVEIKIDTSISSAVRPAPLREATSATSVAGSLSQTSITSVVSSIS